MRNQSKFICLLLVAFALVGCGAGVPMMGIDDNEKYFEYVVSEEEYQKQLTQLIFTAHEAVAPAVAQAESQSKWHLRTIVLGLGLKMEGGLGPVIKGSASPRIRLAFSNSENPVVP